MDLFTHAMNDRMQSEAPLAARYAWRSCGTRRNLDEYIGQEHVIGPGKRRWVHRAAPRHRGRPHVPLHPALGPPGTGKTTLAQVIANTTKSDFITLSAVMAGKADLREVIEKATERRKLYGAKTILFVKDVLETLN